jgi:hypothetical protein
VIQKQTLQQQLLANPEFVERAKRGDSAASIRAWLGDDVSPPTVERACRAVRGHVYKRVPVVPPTVETPATVTPEAKKVGLWSRLFKPEAAQPLTVAEAMRAAETAFAGLPEPTPRATQEAAPIITNDTTQFTENPTTGTATIESPKSGRITSLESLLSAANVDLSVWEVERWVCNKWEIGANNGDGITVEPLFQVKAWLRRIKGVDTLRAIKDELLHQMQQHAPVYPSYTPVEISLERIMAEISIPDLHLGKLAWGEEVDGPNYDSDIAERVFLDAVRSLLQKIAPFKPERITFPIGNDFLHIDNPEGTTRKGTRQDVVTRFNRLFSRGWQLLVQGIDMAAEIAPVDVIPVPGNHDETTVFQLAEVLSAWYRNTDRVSIDNAPTMRKYYRWGTSLIAYTHGNNDKHNDLPMIMAQERPQDWAETTCREFHLGHLHTRRTTKYTAGNTINGVAIRILPSLSATDAWHFSMGYVKGPRAAEVYLYEYSDGYMGHFASNYKGEQ